MLSRRREGQLPEVVAIAVKAQRRLGRKFVRLHNRKHVNVAMTAVGLEVWGFVWAMMRAAPQLGWGAARVEFERRAPVGGSSSEVCGTGYAVTSVARQGQLRTSLRECGIQPADISLKIVGNALRFDRQTAVDSSRSISLQQNQTMGSGVVPRAQPIVVDAGGDRIVHLVAAAPRHGMRPA
jgi:hypothetical protein